MNVPIDRDDQATWRQLRDRLREIREWADYLAAHGDGITAVRWTELTDILDRPRETS